jgi:hypothetical protein
MSFAPVKDTISHHFSFQMTQAQFRFDLLQQNLEMAKCPARGKGPPQGHGQGQEQGQGQGMRVRG